MTPAQWRQIEDLYQAARGTDERRREELLAQAAPEVRTAVRRMLNQPSSGSPLDSPAWEGMTGAHPAIGSQLGPYRIERLMGAGGMGAVFEATDTRLGRRVALKIPSEPFSTRFENEARYVASLNHPNICTLYDVGPNYLVMELVEGTTLAERMDKGPLLPDEATAVALQIAEGLEAAHKQGIIHRDLKPANIRITPNGTVKVLDFGIARRTVAHQTQTTITESGTVLGTPGYMSPEQVRGEELDCRTDVFSLGVVLYQMLTSRTPFPGQTSGVILEAILNRDPAPAKLPPGLERVICKALDKDRNLRYQSAAELRADLLRLQRDRAPAIRKTRSRLWIAGALVLATAVITVVALMRRAPPAPAELVPLRLTSNRPELPVHSAAISPDGQYLAYSDANGIHVKTIQGGDTRLLPDTKDAAVCYWTTDGLRIIGHGPSGYFTVSLVDPNPRLIGSDQPSPDGRFLFHWREDAGPEIRSADGRLAFAVPNGPNGLDWPGWLDSPAFSPRGNLLAVALLHTDSIHDSSSIEVFQLASGRRATLLQPQRRRIAGLVWLDRNRLMYALAEQESEQGWRNSNSNFWVLTVDPESGRPVGPPVRRTHWTDFGISGASATRDGSRVCFQRSKTRVTIWSAALQKNGAGLAGLQPLTQEDSVDVPMAWMPDDRAVLFTSDRTGTRQVYRQQLGQEAAQMLTSGQETGPEVRVSPDGKWILYAVPEASDSGGALVMRMPVAGGTPERVFRSDGNPDFQCSHVPGGPCAVSDELHAKSVVFLFDPLRGRGERVMELEPGSAFAGISPDGKHIAFLPRGITQTRIRVVDLRGILEGDIVVAGAGALWSLDWSSDGSGFFAGDVKENSARLLHIARSGASEVLASGSQDSFYPYAIPSPDGRYIAIAKQSAEANVWMVENP